MAASGNPAVAFEKDLLASQPQENIWCAGCNRTGSFKSEDLELGSGSEPFSENPQIEHPAGSVRAVVTVSAPHGDQGNGAGRERGRWTRGSAQN